MVQCRICLEENIDIENLINPCNCNGTHRFVHRECLNKWLEYNVDNINYTRCQECLVDYKYEEVEAICLINYIKKLHYLIKNCYLINILISYLIFFSLGIVVYLFSNYITSSISTEVVKYASNNIYFNIPVIGNVTFCIINFSYYLILLMYLVVFKKKKLDWVNSKDFTCKKIFVISFMDLVISLWSLPFGLLLNLMFTNIYFIYFLEFYFNKYINGKTRIIDISNDDTMLTLL